MTPALDNEPQTPDQRHIIREYLSNAEAAIQLVEKDIMKAKQEKRQLKQKIEKSRQDRKILVEEIAHYKTVLAAHKILHEGILRHIFSLMAQDHGAVSFPPDKEMPPQVLVSHVCRRWRRIALSTSELWNDVHLTNYSLDEPSNENHCRIWLTRAGNRPLTLRISWSSDDDEERNVEIVKLVRRLAMQFRIKVLHLTLTCNSFLLLRRIPETAFSHLERVEVYFFNGDFPIEDDPDLFDSMPYLTDRIRGFSFHRELLYPAPPFPELAIPWSQLRHFYNYEKMDLSIVAKFLKTMPMLEVLYLHICNDSKTKVDHTLAMPHLYWVDLEIYAEVSEVIPLIECPNAVFLDLEIKREWGNEAYELIKRHFNFERVERVKLNNGYLPLSAILKDLPMLSSLEVASTAIVDDEAITGMANGTLGRCLTTIDFRCPCEVEVILAVVETRQKNVKKILREGCTWREEIWPLQEVKFSKLCFDENYAERVGALERRGIGVFFAAAPPRVRPV